jgi:hypothetical protein
MYRAENVKLRYILQTVGMSEAEVEERLKVSTIDSSSRRGSTQLTGETTISTGANNGHGKEKLDLLLRSASQRISYVKMEDDDEEEDEEEDPSQPIVPSGSKKRSSLAINPGRRIRDHAPSPIRPPDSTLLSQSDPRSISSSAASTPSIDGQAPNPVYPGSLAEPRAPLSRQLAVPAQTELFGVPPQLSPNFYSYSTQPPHPPPSAWPRQDYPPVSVPFSPTASSTISLLRSGDIVTTSGPSFLPPLSVMTHSMGIHAILTAPGYPSQHQQQRQGMRRGTYGNVLPDLNQRPQPNQPDRWN